jgi:hypothetical protein
MLLFLYGGLLNVIRSIFLSHFSWQELRAVMASYMKRLGRCLLRINKRLVASKFFLHYYFYIRGLYFYICGLLNVIRSIFLSHFSWRELRAVMASYMKRLGRCLLRINKRLVASKFFLHYYFYIRGLYFILVA